MTIVFPRIKKAAPNKLADVELHFDDGPLAGLRLVGFTIWRRTKERSVSEEDWGEPERASDDAIAPAAAYPQYVVSFPSRPWKSPQGFRPYALLRALPTPSGLSRAAFMQPVWELRDRILEAYERTLADPSSDWSD